MSPDSRTLVAASRSLACRQWDITTGDCLRTWRVSRGRPAGTPACLGAGCV